MSEIKMKQLITKINREKGYSYNIDKEGNVYKESYNWLKDPYTLVTIAIIILAGAFYLQISNMKTIESNFDEVCVKYCEIRLLWMQAHPGEEPTLKEILKFEVYNGIPLPNE